MPGVRAPESERLDLEQLIRGYTLDAAYQLRMEDRTGSIETGKLADLVVIREPLFEMHNSKEIYKIVPLAVIVAGKVIRGKLQ